MNQFQIHLGTFQFDGEDFVNFRKYELYGTILKNNKYILPENASAYKIECSYRNYFAKY